MSFYPQDPKEVGLNFLPEELVVNIMGNLPARDIRNLAMSSKRLYAVTKCNERNIVRSVLNRTHHPSVIRLARANYAARDSRSLQTRKSLEAKEIHDFCQRYLNRESPPLYLMSNELTVSAAIYMTDFYRIARHLGKSHIDYMLQNWDLSSMEPPRPDEDYKYAASEEEYARAVRALYIIELISKLLPTSPFPDTKMYPGQGDDAWDIFWLNFAPWEADHVSSLETWLESNVRNEATIRVFATDPVYPRPSNWSPSIPQIVYDGIERIFSNNWSPNGSDTLEYMRIRGHLCPRRNVWFQEWTDIDKHNAPLTHTMEATYALKRHGAAGDDTGPASTWYWRYAVELAPFRESFYGHLKLSPEPGVFPWTMHFNNAVLWDRKRLEAGLGYDIPPLEKMKSFITKVID